MSVHAHPSSTLQQLRALLDVGRLVRDEHDLQSLFDRVAATIADALGFATVSINVRRPAWDDFQVMTVHGREGARDLLLGVTTDAASWQPYLDDRFRRRGAYLVLHDEIDWEDASPVWVPDIQPGAEADSWHPEDALIVPLERSDGEVLGFVSVDEPLSGRRPDDDELDLLVALAGHVAAGIESAQNAFLAQRHRAALAQLLEISTQLAAAESVDAVLEAVAHGISSALGFEKVVVALADETGHFVPRGIAGWTEGDPGLDFVLTRGDVCLLLDAERELEGCVLLTHVEAEARVGRGSNYRSRRNGRGPRAWNRHWLIVPLVDADGATVGFVWVDDPEDHLLPSPERLQALRTFANHASVALRAALDVEMLSRRNTELAALHETGFRLLERLELDRVLQVIVEHARTLGNAENGYLYLVEGEPQELRLKVGLGRLENVAVALQRDEGLAGRVWASGSSQATTYDGAAVARGFASVIAVPLLVRNEVVGVLGLAHETVGLSFGEPERALLERFGQLASLALENARLYESAQREIVERDRLHEQLRQAQKMESIGRLAGGIAHDFNNLLTAISGYAELMLMDFDANTVPDRDSAEQIARAAGRAASLTGQLLAFSRKQVLRPQVLDLNEVVGGMATMLARMLGADVVLSTALDSELGPTLADPTQIEQVVLNLALNARDAMPNGGSLMLKTTSLEVGDDDERPHPDLEPGSYVTLAVRDTGVGIAPELVEKVFEPFFTTKGVGEGTGLGLATVEGIVSQSGGVTWVESTLGTGTIFTVCLPRVVA